MKAGTVKTGVLKAIAAEDTGTAGAAEDIESADDLPSCWYAGDMGKKPVVKDQGSYGTCWAITATSALEAALLPAQQIVFSADHITRQNSFTADIEDGGDYLMLMAYLCGWQGPVTEEADPYGDEYSPEGLEAAVHVQEVRVLLNSSIEKIKETVYTYGSVQASLYMDRTTVAEGAGYYNASDSSYYYTEEMTQNHDVLILGWDDSWPAEYFAETPEQDGAFICLNTWGSDFGEDGIFYVSYADPNITSVCVAYTRIESADNYDHLYQYDDCGWQGQQGYNSSECWFANVYTAEGEENLAAVGFYATGENTSYEIYLVHDFTGTDSLENMEYLQSGSFTDMGYYTIDLEDVQELASGERFAVAVKIDVPGAENPVAVEYHSDDFTQNVTTEGKESYISQYGTLWENTQEKFETNVCLKVYTVDR
ncbi:MAG: lectin like domain-containing protein [Lachnospiraceae bacterium]|nr:lectin like domain-containing protein [Lachnospiraceae bacterium]